MILRGPVLALVLLGLVPVAAWPASSRTVAFLWVLGVLVLVVADVLLTPSPRSVTLSRSGVPQVRLEEPTTTTLTLTGTGSRHLRGHLRDAWVPSAGAAGERHVLDLPAGERRRVTTTLRPTRRGDRPAAGVTLRVHGPLGLAGRQATIAVPGAVRVLPPFRSRRHLSSKLEQLRQLDGRAAVRTRGQGTEFDSLRDYVEGDDVRAIDWRATARRQHVVVRTWQPERDRRLILVLDTSRTSAARVGDEPRLDAAMDAALLLAAVASHAGDRVDLLAGDRLVRARVGSGASTGTTRSAVLHRLVTAMAPLEPVLVEADWTTLAGAVTALTRRRSLVVLLTPLEPAAVESGLLPVLPSLTAHHRVVVASVADPAVAALRADLSSLEAVYDAAAAERTEALRRRTAAGLGALGVTVVDEPPERLPVALVDHYLALKARGLL
ncbi:DUF58 domain-containing protein [Ornithinimicrobium cerasi]|uniref:Uncharacterized conserved protein, DUF58 family, contains vWF domain n=1 Tax=Ornithinimicrobium cerasi TaxID=2248773 RepID=A0A285VND5_9MICO|nr:DUF58 domain-containing protein [Ornithinimicrobium cerasi]SOC55473.1 Uncharacterized conserved protein, DUF58 family, contains vWF domain [Ornithinimicrobium cerasi]